MNACDVHPLRILGIGNSFLRNATEMLPDLVQEIGHPWVMLKAAPGGWSLAQHVQGATLFDADPNQPGARPYAHQDQPFALQEALVAELWGVVTIQQRSIESFRMESYQPHARDLVAIIRHYAPQAEIAIHQTWAYREDSKRAYREDFGQAEMYQELTRAYHALAAELQLSRLIPVGDAFRLAAESPEGRFAPDPDFDYAHPVFPALPRECNSLHVGYHWVGDTPDRPKVFRQDAWHANDDGKYLGACVWLESLFGADATRIRFKPESLTEDRADFLRNIAHQVVADGMRPGTSADIAMS